MLCGLKTDKVNINILQDVSGIIKPCRYVNTKIPSCKMCDVQILSLAPN
jgi:hypothetical protein